MANIRWHHVDNAIRRLDNTACQIDINTIETSICVSFRPDELHVLEVHIAEHKTNDLIEQLKQVYWAKPRIKSLWIEHDRAGTIGKLVDVFQDTLMLGSIITKLSRPTFMYLMDSFVFYHGV